MANAKGIVVALALLTFGLAGPAFAENPGLRRCTKTIEITTESSVSISSRPSLICSVQLIATGGSAYGVVFDSPSNTDQQSSQHQQFVVKAEPGVASSGNSAYGYFGDQNLLTNFGLGAYVVNGRLIVSYDD